jgi:hypothetical protein
MKRSIRILLVAAFLILVATFPVLATVIDATLGLFLDGAVQLLSQQAVLVVVVGLAAFFYFRHRPAPARRAA